MCKIKDVFYYISGNIENYNIVLTKIKIKENLFNFITFKKKKFYY